jgi:hypothetical protein
VPAEPNARRLAGVSGTRVSDPSMEQASRSCAARKLTLGLWRHIRRHWPLSYEPTLWSVVFPLGMYSVATLSFGKVAHLNFMEPLSRFMLWVAVAAWVVVAVAFIVRIGRRPAGPASGAPAASASATTNAT